MPERILVLRGGALGDFILTLPAIGLLRRSYPEARIEIIGYRKIIALSEGRFYADATRCIEYAPMASFFQNLHLPDRELAHYFASFDLIISYFSDPQAIFKNNLQQVGISHLIEGFSNMNDHLPASRQLAEPLRELKLPLFLSEFLENDLAARFYPSKEDSHSAREFLVPLEKKRLIALHPGSGSTSKNWPVTQWEAICKRILSQDPETHLLLISGEADQKIVSLLAPHLPPDRKTLLKEFPLPLLGAILARCHLFLGHDSGISHLAASSGCPSLLLFGPTNPKVWAPLHSSTHLITAKDGRMISISPEEVWEKIVPFLSADSLT